MHLFQTAQRWSLHTLLPAMLCLTCSSFISLEANEPPVVHAGPPPVMEHAWVAGPLVRSVSAQLAELLADYIGDPDGDPLSIKIVAMQGLWERSNDAAFDAPQPVQSGDIVPLTAWVRFRPVPYSFPPGNPGLLESALEFRAWDGQALSATVGTITVSYQNTAPQLAAALINGNEATPQWTLHAEVIDATATIYLLAEDQEGDSVTWGYFSNAGVLVPITGAQENVSDAAVHGRVSLYPDPDLGILQIYYTATTPGGLNDLLRLAILGPFGEQQEITIHYTHAPVEPTSLPQVSVMVIDPIAVEGSGEGNPARIRIMRTAVSGSPLTVYFQKSGIAVPAYDYVDIGTAATIPANQVAVDIVVQSLFVDGFSEGAESVRITLTEHQTYEIIEPRSAEVYIFDVGYEPPTVSLSATPLHIREDDPMGELSITVERTGNLVGPLFVSLAVHGTALEGVDYNGFFGIGDPVVIIPHGLSAVTLESFVINDELAEDLETIDIEIVPLVTYVRAPASRIVIEITDDDGGSAVPIVSVTAEDAEASEGTPPDSARLIFARTGDLTQPLFVHVTWNGSAQNALDVVTLEETVIIPANFPSIEVLVIPIDDHIDEPEEVLVISIVAQPTYQVGDPASALITIGDNDKPSVSLVAMDSQAAEGPTPDTGMITIYREGVLSEELTVVLAISGTATGGTDYEALGTSVTIPAGEAQVTLTVTPLEDTEFEGAETVVVSIAASAAYTVGSPSSATVTIADNDLPVVSITAVDGEAAEGTPVNTGQLRIQRTGTPAAALTVVLAISGTATGGTDYEALGTSVTIPEGEAQVTLTVTPLEDTEFEGAETVVVGIAASAAYTVGSPSSATVTIADNDLPVVSITALDAEAAEGTPVNTGQLRIQRTGTTAAALTVVLAISGTATGGTDYEALGTSVTIPEGEAQVTLTVTPLDDTEFEGAETVVVGIAASAAYIVGSPSSATVTIADNDLPVVSIMAVDGEAAEGTPLNTGQLRIQRTGTTAAALTVVLAISGTATGGTDYEALGTSVTIPEGEAQVTLTVTPLDDTEFEGAETVVVSIAASAAYTVGSPSSATVTIADNDLPVVSITAVDGEAAEGTPVNTGQLRIERTGTTAAALTVVLAISGTATGGTDYEALGTSVTIPEGEAQLTLTVTPLDDTEFEGAETVVVGIAASAAYTVGSPSSATVT
ncbi:MAG: hypothetical protein NZ552_01865, partial [Planctomycetes bacterium]|nr:hypothetical protein [Planctomycetota bacterium]